MTGHDLEVLGGEGYAETSQYAAHLDRGWSMLDRGDHMAARRSAQHAQQLRPESPDAAVLLAAVSLAEGEAEESVRWYERAQELDPDYVEPYAAAAHVVLFDLRDPARALAFCDHALSLAGSDPLERIDLELLATECKLLSEQGQEARRQLQGIQGLDVVEAALLSEGDDVGEAIGQLLGGMQEDGLDDEERAETIQKALQLALRLARLWLDLNEPDGALPWLRRIVKRFPADSDAWYLLSEAETMGGDGRTSACAALQSLQLDMQWELPDWVPPPPDLHRRVVELLRDSVDNELTKTMEAGGTFVVLIHETPAVELVLEGLDPRAPVLALATRPPSDPGKQAPATLRPELTGIAVYRRNLARICDGEARFDQELRGAVDDELTAFSDSLATFHAEPNEGLSVPGPASSPRCRTRKSD
ncbi:MAG: tetratricopeptide repeat protein [Nannocystaceae bacterium]